jgi:hypothetical protein
MISQTPVDPPRSLCQLQQWLQSVITHPKGIEAGVLGNTTGETICDSIDQLETIISPSRRLGSADRLRIYGQAYFSRLVECLRAEFPTMVRVLGIEAFDRLAFGYLLEQPSQSYTLSKLAEAFPDYLLRTRPPREENASHHSSVAADFFLSPSVQSDIESSSSPDFADFLIDLATLERTYSEVFDGNGPEQTASLHPSDLKGLTTEKFVVSGIVFHDCVRLMTFRFPVHDYVTASRSDASSCFPLHRVTHLVVTRRQFVVRRFEVSPIQFSILSQLQRGTSIGDVLHSIPPDNGLQIHEWIANLRRWFFEWTAAPLFQRLDHERIQ